MHFTVGNVLRDAFEELESHWRALLRALFLPALAISVVETIEFRWPEADGFYVLSLLRLFLFALFAVSCHRIILLGEDRLKSPFGVYASKEVLKYAGVSFLLGASVALVFMLIAGFVGYSMPQSGGAGPLILLLMFLVAALTIIAVGARICPIFPSIAVNDGRTLSDIMDLTEDAWIGMLVLLILPVLIISLASYPLIHLAESTGTLALTLFAFFIICMFDAFAVAVISCAYRALCRDAGSP